jgi:DNA-binding transcriptional MerR regulator
VSNLAAAGLTISAVSARTGVGVSVLRAWERRHGFPVPQRLPGGHRRYAEEEVDRIRRVVAEREAGRSLEAAIALVRSDATAAPAGLRAGEDRSIFAGLRRLRPDLPAHPLRRRTMLALSQSIEDEARARADRPHVIAAFQSVVAVDAARARWADLIDTSASTILFADFPSSLVEGGSLHVAIPDGDPMQREWSVVVDAPGSAAVLAGWERPDGRFEAIWTVDAQAVRLATHLGRQLAVQHAPGLPVPPGPGRPPDDDPGGAAQRSSAVADRLVAYLDR